MAYIFFVDREEVEAMRLFEYLGIVLLALLAALVMFNGIEKAINVSVSQTAEQIQKAGR